MIVTLFPPILSAIAPKIGANIPHISIWIPIAKPNCVMVHCKSLTKKSENNPNVCLTPKEIITTKLDAINVIKAVLFWKKLENCPY